MAFLVLGKDYVDAVLEKNKKYLKELIDETWKIMKHHEIVMDCDSERKVVHAFGEAEDHLREIRKIYKDLCGGSKEYTAQLKMLEDEFDEFMIELFDELDVMEEAMVCKENQPKPYEPSSGMEEAVVCKEMQSKPCELSSNEEAVLCKDLQPQESDVPATIPEEPVVKFSSE